MTNRLITKCADKLKARKYTQTSSIADKIERGKGIAYVKFKKDGETYYVRAKKYVYKNLAPFGVEQVADAMRDRAKLVIYYDDEESFYVFDPSYVDENGSLTSGRSKRSDDRPWIELSRKHGVTLSGYETGSEPDVLESTDPGDNATLGEWSQ